MQIDKRTLRRLWPNAPAALVDSVADSSATVLQKHKINTPLRLAHFLSQISHESNGGTVTAENMSYTTAARIAAVWPSRFTPESAQAYVRNPKALAAKVYNGRMGNVPGTMDGYTYRGRGLLQLTGKSSYADIGRKTGLDLVGNPDLAFAPETALEVAAAEFVTLKCLPACDADDLRLVTRRVNGGYIGLDSRKQWLRKWKLALPDLPGELPTTSGGIAELDAPEPRGGDVEPVKGMARSTEGNAAIGGGTLAAIQTASEVSSSVKEIKSNADDAGLFDVLGHLVSRPSFWIGVLIIVVAAYIWWRRRQRMQEQGI